MAIDWGVVARAIHVLGVVAWIGGVWVVTTLLLPAMKQKPPEEWICEFHATEHRFAPQARIAVLLVLLSGLYMGLPQDWGCNGQGIFSRLSFWPGVDAWRGFCGW
jgi:uncharacterized membrane protein